MFKGKRNKVARRCRILEQYGFVKEVRGITGAAYRITPEGQSRLDGYRLGRAL